MNPFDATGQFLSEVFIFITNPLKFYLTFQDLKISRFFGLASQEAISVQYCLRCWSYNCLF